MTDVKKYRGIIPAFYACYDAAGNMDPEAVGALTRWFIEKGVNGLYIGGSSGECIYQSKEERKLVLERVMAEAKGKITVIAHVACNNTADSRELAAHAESLGVDAIAAIPPIYFKLPPHAIAQYWNDISAAAPNTDFVIYNIPQLAGVSLTPALLREMLKNPRVIGVKNSSMPIQDIEEFRAEGCIVFNGPDEQLLSGLVAGAAGGIGGTYGVMPELYIKIFNLVQENRIGEARAIQDDCLKIILALCSCKGNMYAVIKECIRRLGGPDCGGVRAPLYNLVPEDMAQVDKCVELIRAAYEKHL